VNLSRSCEIEFLKISFIETIRKMNDEAVSRFERTGTTFEKYTSSLHALDRAIQAFTDCVDA
jgi:hypothetical protein